MDWNPHPKQEEFISLPFTVFEGLYGGAAGGGKSELLVLLPLLYGFYNHKDYKGIILRRTFPELESEIIVRSQRYYKQFGATYNEQKRRWTFPSGAIQFFGHAEHENDIRKYDSSEYNYIAFDELTHFTEFQYSYLAFSRCRSSNPELPSIVRSATNPGNIGHGWVRRRFVEPHPEGGRIVVDGITGNKRFFIQAKASDNPFLDPNYVSRLEMLPEAEKRAKLYGDWWTFSGQVFTDFRAKQIPDEPPNALHVVEPFEIPEWWPRVIAIDWGTAALTYVLWGAISPEGRCYIYREYACNGQESHPNLAQNVKVASWASDVGIISSKERGRIVDVVLDSNAWDNRGEDLSVADQFATFSGFTPRKADKGPGSRVSGRALVEEYLRWKPKPKLVTEKYDDEYAKWLLREKGFMDYQGYMDSFSIVKDETNLPKLQIFSSCQILIDTLPLCIWDDSNKEDVAQFSGDDPYDCIRYLLKSVHHYSAVSESRQKQVRMLAKAESYADAGNYNAYFMTLKKIESEKKYYGVPRLRRRFV